MNEENEQEFGLMTTDCASVECTNIRCYSTGSTGATPTAIPAYIERCYEPDWMGGDVINTHCGCGYFH